MLRGRGHGQLLTVAQQEQLRATERAVPLVGPAVGRVLDHEAAEAALHPERTERDIERLVRLASFFGGRAQHAAQQSAAQMRIRLGLPAAAPAAAPAALAVAARVRPPAHGQDGGDARGPAVDGAVVGGGAEGGNRWRTGHRSLSYCNALPMNFDLGRNNSRQRVSPPLRDLELRRRIHKGHSCAGAAARRTRPQMTAWCPVRLPRIDGQICSWV
jgi:hypothetical protein